MERSFAFCLPLAWDREAEGLVLLDEVWVLGLLVVVVVVMVSTPIILAYRGPMMLSPVSVLEGWSSVVLPLFISGSACASREVVEFSVGWEVLGSTSSFSLFSFFGLFPLFSLFFPSFSALLSFFRSR